MTVTKAVCSSCGAALTVPPGHSSVLCPFCGTQYYVSRDNIGSNTEYEICGKVLVKYNGSSDYPYIPDNVEKIGNYAFSGSYIKEITIPDNIKIIGMYAFADCTELKTVHIPATVEEVGHRAFCRCSSLTDVTTEISLPRDVFVGTPFLTSILDKERACRLDTITKIAEEEKRKGCYIATAVYGSYNAPETCTLRRFRDRFLDKFFLGRLFIKTYYSISPRLVEKYGGNTRLTSFCRKILDRFVAFLNNKGYSSDEYTDT